MLLFLAEFSELRLQRKAGLMFPENTQSFCSKKLTIKLLSLLKARYKNLKKITKNTNFVIKVSIFEDSIPTIVFL